MRIDDIAKEFIKQAIKRGISSREEMQKLKNEFSSMYKITSLTSVELINSYEELVRADEIEPSLEFERLIRKRGVRSTSGIAAVTVITKDFACPGKCVYCPKEPDMPKSYLSNEPACMRAILNDFDPYRQVVSRLKGLAKTGHSTEKIEMIVAGGTFNFYPDAYQKSFVKGVFNGLNFDVVDEKADEKASVSQKAAAFTSRGTGASMSGGTGASAGTLKQAQKINETSKHRCVGLSLETRPDYVTKEALVSFRKLGCTKVEIGVQCLDDEIYALNKRGHKVSDVRKAMKLLKDAGFKINVHFMPNMYGSSLEKDLMMFKMLFDDPDFRPDWLKIYPCVVVPYSALEKIYRKGLHEPYSDEKLIDLLVKFKEIVPEYCRITRLYRDIPAESIIAGSKISNLRQVVQQRMLECGKKCKCIRCRELKDAKYVSSDVELKVEEYDSSGGKEYFISFNDVKNDKLIGYLRLRVTSQHFSGEKHWIGELSNTSVIREIHVFGEQVGISKRVDMAGQHMGYGKKLIDKAIELTKSYSINRLAVISGVGVREYYRKLGFEDGGLYQILTIK